MCNTVPCCESGGRPRAFSRARSPAVFGPQGAFADGDEGPRPTKTSTRNPAETPSPTAMPAQNARRATGRRQRGGGGVGGPNRRFLPACRGGPIGAPVYGDTDLRLGRKLRRELLLRYPLGLCDAAPPARPQPADVEAAGDREGRRERRKRVAAREVEHERHRHGAGAEAARHEQEAAAVASEE